MGATPGFAEVPPARDPVRRWIYTQSVKGRWQGVHRASGWLLQAILVVVPWLSVGGHPAVQLDLDGRRLYALGEVFTPRDTIFLVLLLLFSTFSLFFVTALYGRVWCGYACPQTVFLEEWIRPLERWIEGERGTRMLRDKKGWTFDNTWRKVAKWAAFATVAFVVAMSFVSWFEGARDLWGGRAGPFAYGAVALLSGVMFWDFAWFREQFCNYLCPYARFQGALCDDQSLVVAYDPARGEPRGKPARHADAATAPRIVPPAPAPSGAPPDLAPLRAEGDGPLRVGVDGQVSLALAAPSGACIDCRKCVTVCPQGIDIRDGFQLECITCGRCVDACTGVMEKQGQPTLVNYQQLVKGPLVRPRTVVYAALLTGLAAAFLFLLVQRHDADANLARAPGTMSQVDPDGWARNTWLLRVSSKTDQPTTWTLAMEGLPPGAEVLVAPVQLAPGESRTVPVVARVPPGTVPGGTNRRVTARLTAGDDSLDLATTFLGAS